MDETLQTEKLQPRRTPPWLLGALVMGLTALLAVLQVAGLWEIVPSDTATDALLLYALSVFNFVAFVVFSFIFVRSLFKLRRERRERKLGSKLKTRLVVYFIALSLLPITAMAVFSYLFFNRSLEKWFSGLPEAVLRDARNMQSQALLEQQDALQAKAKLIAAALNAGNSNAPDAMSADELRRQANLTALMMTNAAGDIIVNLSAPLNDADRAELEQTLQLARGEPTDARLRDGKDYDAARALFGAGQTLIIVSPRRNLLDVGATITGSAQEFDRLKSQQRLVRRIGLTALGLLTFLLLFASSWIALHLGRNITTPLLALVEGAKEVARGNLAYRVTAFADDEIALLAESFNQMTAQLAHNRGALEANAEKLRVTNEELNERRAYIETVLESLSTGVISLDERERVSTINAAALMMLDLNPAALAAQSLSELLDEKTYAKIERVVRRARRLGRAIEQTVFEFKYQDAITDLPVALTATSLHNVNGKTGGVVLMMEDLSELIAAQRAAAWSEVARRMAHEIKNPLTPIQLAAERIAKNFKRFLDANNAENSAARPIQANRAGLPSRAAQISASVVAAPGLSPINTLTLGNIVADSTATIKREVAGLKAMVDEFAQFARLPQVKFVVGDANEILLQAVALYQDRTPEIKLVNKLESALPALLVDPEQLRRVFVNLIDNALEAMTGNADERTAEIVTQHDAARGMIIISIADSGSGIARADYAKLFQPYFSTKGRGTGLGLAIVQRIVTEHGGKIRAEANSSRGAKFVIELPTAAPLEKQSA